MADRTVTVNLRASVASYLSSMAAAGKATQGFAGGLARVGAGLTKFVTLPVLAAGAASVKAAMDWESAFAGVRKTVEATEPQFKKLEAGLRGMATQLPATHEEIAGVAESAGQLGIALPSIQSFTRAMIDMGETTNLSAEEASQAMARLGNIMQMPEDQFRRLGSTIVDLGNKGAATEQEILQMGLRIAGAGHQLGLSEAEVVSFGEALASVGVRAEAGGSGISKAFIQISEHISTAGEELDLLADTAGVTVPKFSRLFEQDAAEAMTLFVEGLGEVKKEGGDVFKVLDDLGLSEIRMRDALLRLAGAGDLLRNSLDTGNKAWEENIALTEEAGKRYKTTESQMKVTWNQVKDLGITLGQELLPIAKQVLEGIRGLVRGFSGLSEGMQGTIVQAALIAAAFGPVISILARVIKLATAAKVALVGTTAAAAASKQIPGQGVLPGMGPPAAAVSPAVAGGLSAAAIVASVIAFKGAFDSASASAEGFGVSAAQAGKSAQEAGEGVADLAKEGWNLGDALFGANFPGLAGQIGGYAAGVEDAEQATKAWNKATFDTTAAQQQFSTVIADARGITTRQRVAIAHTVNAINQMGGSLGKTKAAMVGNLLAVGDYRGAMALLQGALDHATGKMKKNKAGADAAGEAAADAAQKAKGMAAAMEEIPDAKETKITTPGLQAARVGVSGLASDLNSLKDQSVTVTTHFVSKGTSGFHQVQHAGGIAGASGARRYHGGNLRGNEVHAILERGEGIIPVAQMRALQSGGRSSNPKGMVLSGTLKTAFGPAEMEAVVVDVIEDGRALSTALMRHTRGGR